MARMPGVSLRWKRLRDVAAAKIARLSRELRFYQLLAKDSRTPRASQALLAFAIGYLLMPFDIIPDFIPVLGLLDDLLIVPTVVFVALRLIPREVIADCRARAVSVENGLTVLGSGKPEPRSNA